MHEDKDQDQGEGRRWISQPLSRVVGDGVEAPTEADLEPGDHDEDDAGRWLP